MSYKLVKGIIKVINPKDKPVIGIGDGVGNFTWIPTDKMIDYFPKPYTQWQTTFFKMDIVFEPKWREEKNFEQYAYTYEQNTIEAPANVPPDFLTVQTQTTQTQPTNYPQPSQTAQTLPIPDPVSMTPITDPFIDPVPPPMDGSSWTSPSVISASPYQFETKGIGDKLIELIETQNGILQNILNAIIGSKTNVNITKTAIHPIGTGLDLDTSKATKDEIPKLDF